jgi:hypothetical protein
MFMRENPRPIVAQIRRAGTSIVRKMRLDFARRKERS